MVLDLAGMDFNLKVKWWVRPRQLDGSTVEDYYTQFCNWRDEMVRLSIPAEEEDYVEQFILNLRWEIRYRLYRYESWSRLIDVFRAAKFEESMMIIEENLRQIKAHMVFDEMSHPENGKNDEIQGAEVASDANSDEILVRIEEDTGNDVSPNAEDYKSTGLEFLVTNAHPDDTIEDAAACECEPNVHKFEAFISAAPITGISSANTYAVRFEEEVHGRENVTEGDRCSEVCNAFDEFTEATPTALLNEQENGHYAHNLFDECPQPFFVEQSSIAGNDHKGGVVLPMLNLRSVFNPMDATTMNGSCTGSTKASIVESAPIMESVCGKPVMNDDDHAHKVFDIGTDPSHVLQHSYPTKVDNQLFDYKLDDKMWLNELHMRIFDPGGVLFRFDVLLIVAVQSFLSSEYVGAVKGLINGSPTPWFGKVTSIKEVDLGKSIRESTTHRVLNHRVLNEVPKLTYVDSNEESYAYDGSITSIHCVSFVFDSSNGLRCVEARGLFVPMSLNSKVPLSPNSVIMVCYCPIIARTCHLFDPGGGYLSLLANHDTLIDNCARNDESPMPDDMCVSIVEWGSKKACKPLMQLMVDYKCWTPRASNSADIDMILMKFCVSSDSVLSRVTILPTQQDVRLIGIFFVAADKIEFPSSEAHHMVIMGNKLRKLHSLCVKSFMGKTVNQLTISTSWQKVWSPDSIQRTQALIETQQQLGQLLTCTYLNFQDSFSVKLDRGIYSYTHTIFILVLNDTDSLKMIEVHMIGKDSSNQRDMGGFGLIILHLGLGRLGPKRIELGFALKYLKHYEWYMSLKGCDGVTIVKFHVFIWDPGENVNSSYILEDKDAVVRVGKDMVLMDATLAIRNYDHEVQMSCLVIMNIVFCQECMVTYYNCKHVLNDILLQVKQCAKHQKKKETMCRSVR